MLQMTFQGRCLFLGKMRKHGDTICDELNDALESGKTTMTAVIAMKNRGLAMLQDSDEANHGADDRIDRLERNLARIAKALGVDLESDEDPAPSKPPRGRKAN